MRTRQSVLFADLRGGTGKLQLCRRAGIAVVGVVLGLFAQAVPASAGPSGESVTPSVARPSVGPRVPANIRVARAVYEFEATHKPHDYVGLNRAIVAAGGDPVRFDFPLAGLEGLSPEEAQAAYDATQQSPGTGVGPLATLPQDTFTVGGYWSRVQDQDGEFFTYYGNWDFKNTYEGGNAPYDAMAVQTRDVRSNCHAHSGDGAWAFSRAGANTSWLIGRHGADFDSAVWNIDDSWMQSDAFYVDRGTLYISYQTIGACSSLPIYGKTYYEHNDGGCVCSWGFSISAASMSLSYSGSVPATILQKSTSLIRVFT